MVALKMEHGQDNNHDTVLQSHEVIYRGYRCNTPPPAPSLSMVFGANKSFNFRWSATDNTDYYQLLEDADGQSGFQTVGEDIAQKIDSIGHQVPLYKRLNARYRLRSCNSMACCESSTLNIRAMTTQINQSIGYIKPANLSFDDQFGQALSLSGDGKTLAIGALYDDQNDLSSYHEDLESYAFDSGAVYLYRLQQGAWAFHYYLKASNTGAGDRFGAAVQLNENGSVLIVGAPKEDSNGSSEDNDEADAAGAAYVFELDEDSIHWQQTGYLKAGSPSNDDDFGHAVSLNRQGNLLAVAAPGKDGGQVYTFQRGTGSMATTEHSASRSL